MQQQKSIGEYNLTPNHNPTMLDIVGEVFGYLTVNEYVGRSGERNMYRCICACGQEVIAGRQNIKSGNTKSCGCKAKELQLSKRIKHGMHESRTYGVWEGMIDRCHNKSSRGYKNYGARGITVCSSWRDFRNFFKDMGEAPNGMQIDRINNDLGYSPDNCRWVTPVENCRNKRTNVLITIKGVTRCVEEWSKITGITDETIRYRFHQGWPEEKILSKNHRGVSENNALKVRDEPGRMVE